MRWPGARNARPGWVKAPSSVEVEIRTVWQEDEMPEELTSSPGYVPFTLGPEAQDWVDSMAEVVDGGAAVYGRPKPAVAPARRQLAVPPPPAATPPVTAQRTPTPPAMPSPRTPTPPPKPRVLMPDIAETEPVHTQPRMTMPEVGVASSHASMPDVGASAPHGTMPEVGASSRHVTMPDVGAPRHRTLPKRVLMPDIGEDAPEPPESPENPMMPEIG